MKALPTITPASVLTMSYWNLLYGVFCFTSAIFWVSDLDCFCRVRISIISASFTCAVLLLRERGMGMLRNFRPRCLCEQAIARTRAYYYTRQLMSHLQASLTRLYFLMLRAITHLLTQTVQGGNRTLLVLIFGDGRERTNNRLL